MWYLSTIQENLSNTSPLFLEGLYKKQNGSPKSQPSQVRQKSAPPTKHLALQIKKKVQLRRGCDMKAWLCYEGQSNTGEHHERRTSWEENIMREHQELWRTSCNREDNWEPKTVFLGAQSNKQIPGLVTREFFGHWEKFISISQQHLQQAMPDGALDGRQPHTVQRASLLHGTSKAMSKMNQRVNFPWNQKKNKPIIFHACYCTIASKINGTPNGVQLSKKKKTVVNWSTL